MLRKQVSIIIPIYNASDYIENTFSSIFNQTIDNFEVILVDDCSSDDSIQKAEKYPVKIIKLKERGGPGNARNYGAKNSAGDMLIFVDADITLKPDSIKKITSNLYGSGADAISGFFTEEVPNSNFFSDFQNLLLIFRYLKLPRVISATFSYFCAIKRNAFEMVGGYNEKMSAYEDIELGHRLTKKGYRCEFDHTLKVTHFKKMSHSELLNDYFKKVAAVTNYYRYGNFSKDSKSDNIRLSIKVAYISSCGMLFSLSLIKISLIPFILFFSIYSISIAPFMFFLTKTRDFYFSLKSYFVCIEVFLVSLTAFVYGLLMRNRNE